MHANSGVGFSSHGLRASQECHNTAARREALSPVELSWMQTEPVTVLRGTARAAQRAGHRPRLIAQRGNRALTLLPLATAKPRCPRQPALSPYAGRYVGTQHARSAPHWHVLSSRFVLVVSSWDPLPAGGPQGGSLTCRLPPWPGRGPQERSRQSAGSSCGLRCCSPPPSARGHGCGWGEQAQRQPQAAMSPFPQCSRAGRGAKPGQSERPFSWWGWQRGQTWQVRAPLQLLGLAEGPNLASQSPPSATGDGGEVLAVPS